MDDCRWWMKSDICFVSPTSGLTARIAAGSSNWLTRRPSTLMCRSGNAPTAVSRVFGTNADRGLGPARR